MSEIIQVKIDRLEHVLTVLAEATLGNYDVRIPDLDDAAEDQFLEIEVAANMLLDELKVARRRNEEHRREIARQTEQLQLQQAELLRALSTPIIRVAVGVLALPIIGAVADERAQNMTEELLSRVVSERATHVILDMTGAGEVAAGTAQSLLKMAQAIRLLGASCIVTGISPNMAATLVTLHFDLSQLKTLPQLVDALSLVLKEKSGQRPGAEK